MRTVGSRALGLLALAGSLAGCAAALPPAPPPAALPASFASSDAEGWTRPPAADPRLPGEWWVAFGDETLAALIRRADTSAESIRLAAARVAQARALRRAAQAERSPSIGARAGANRQGGPLINAAGGDGSLFTAAIDLSYDVDLSGRLVRAATAGDLDLRAQHALLGATRLAVQAEVAHLYYGLRAADAEIGLLRATRGTYEDASRLAEQRLRLGTVAELDVVRLRAEAATADAELADLERQRALLAHALATLLAQPGATIALDEASWQTTPPVVPPGVPSVVLARRPDVTAAEQAMQAARLRVGVARSAWFPNLSLTANGGYASPQLSDLFTLPMRAWGIGVLGALPLFDGGRREAAVDSASAQFDATLSLYREQLLVAFREVQDQLSSLRWLAAQQDAQTRAVQASILASQLSESRYRSGLGSQLDHLDARRSELRARRQMLRIRAARFQSTVALVRALGGGWSQEPLPAPQAQR